MKIFQLNRSEMEIFHSDTAPKVRNIVLECQPYGNENEQVYNLAIALEDLDNLLSLNIGRELEDKGRTVGFWQNCGGEGVFKPRSSGTQGFSENLYKIVATQPDAKIYFEGSSWEQILRSMPFTDEQKKWFLGDGEEPTVVSTKKSSKRSGKKRR